MGYSEYIHMYVKYVKQQTTLVLYFKFDIYNYKI